MYRHHVESCSSTMDVARDLLLDPTLVLEELGLVTTVAQSAGRGRRGNNWITPPPGAFLGTFWVRTDLSPAQLSGLSLAVGVFIVEAVNALGRSLWLKWPNDLVDSDGGKVGGVLIEVIQDAQQRQAVLIGIGVNWSTPSGVTGGNIPSSFTKLPLRGSGKAAAAITPPMLREEIGERFPQFWRNFQRTGIAGFIPRWRDVSLQLGKQVEFSRGDQREQGTFCDVGENGEAIIELHGKRERIFSGEIHSVRIAPAKTAQ